MTTEHHVKCKETAQAYCVFYEHISKERLGDLNNILSEDIHFIDPFNDIVGRDQVKFLLEKMFEDVDNPRFQILDLVWSETTCFMRWDFSCYQRMLGNLSFRGMTEIHFDDEARIRAHYDYWDSGKHFYAKLPLLGRIIRAIIRKASIS